MKIIFFLFILLSVSLNAQWLKINQIRDLADSLQAKINKKDSTLYTSLYRAQIIARDSSLAAQNRAQDYTESRLAANPYGWQTKSQVESIAGDSTNVLRGLIGSGGGGVDTNTVKAIAGNSIKDSLDVNSRGWQTAAQVTQALTDSLNANARGWRNSAQAKQDAVDTISALPLSSNPTTDNYIIGETGTGLNKFVLDDLPVSRNQNIAISERASITELNNVYLLINYLDSVVQYQSKQIDTLKLLLANNVNPFPSVPTNLAVVYTTSSSIRISWTNSTDLYDSTAIYYSVSGLGAPIVTTVYQHKDSTAYTITGLSPSTSYDIYLRHRNGSVFSGASDIITATTSGWLPNIAYLQGQSLADYSLIQTEASNTFTISNNTYKAYYDSGATFSETAYGQKTFGIRYTNTYAGVVVIIPSLVNMIATSGGRHYILSLQDTVTGLGASFGFEDSDANRTADRWYLRYRNGGSYLTSTSTAKFSLDTIKFIEMMVSEVNSSLVVRVNGDTIINLTSRDFSTWNVNAVVVGNGLLTNQYAYKTTWYYDNIYVDSSGFAPDSWRNYNYTGGSEPTRDIIADYFVDYLNGDNSNDGKSINTPFKHCPGDPLATGTPSTITLQPGDTVIFKGGVEYLGQVLINNNGTASDSIVFIGNSGWGSGRAIFNMQDTRQYAFKGGRDYIKIQGFNFYNYPVTGSDYVIYPTSGASHWLIDSCTFAFLTGWNNTTTFPSKAAILLTNTTSNFTIRNCEFFANGQTTIRLRYVSNVNILNNNFGGINRGDSTGWFSVAIRGEVNSNNVIVRNNVFHDGWQYGGNVYPELNHAPAYIHVYGTADGVYNTSNDPYDWTIEKNFFYNNLQIYQGTGTADIEITTDCKRFKIRNNISANPLTHNIGNIVVASRADSIWVENNTFIARDYSGTASGEIISNITIYTTTDLNGVGDSVWVRNNLFYNDNNMIPAYNVRLTSTATSFRGVIDYNGYYNIDNVSFYAGSAMTFTTWQSYGYDTNSNFYTTGTTIFNDLPTNPVYTSSGNYRLNSLAPTFLKTGGLTLSGFTDDFTGTTRTAGWSIGAYEY